MKLPEREVRKIADALYNRIAAQVGATPEDTITEETVTGLTDDGRYIVADTPIPVIGSGIPRVGQRVHVLWKAGRATGILMQRVKRAQVGMGRAGGRLLEGLWLIQSELASGPAAGWEIWFQDGAQFVRLVAAATFGADVPARVKWGQLDNSFVVEAKKDGLSGVTNLRYHIFRMGREAGRAADGAAPSASRLRMVLIPTVSGLTPESPATFPGDFAGGGPQPVTGPVFELGEDLGLTWAVIREFSVSGTAYSYAYVIQEAAGAGSVGWSKRLTATIPASDSVTAARVIRWGAGGKLVACARRAISSAFVESGTLPAASHWGNIPYGVTTFSVTLTFSVEPPSGPAAYVRTLTDTIVGTQTVAWSGGPPPAAQTFAYGLYVVTLASGGIVASSSIVDFFATPSIREAWVETQEVTYTPNETWAPPVVGPSTYAGSGASREFGRLSIKPGASEVAASLHVLPGDVTALGAWVVDVATALPGFSVVPYYPNQDIGIAAVPGSLALYPVNLSDVARIRTGFGPATPEQLDSCVLAEASPAIAALPMSWSDEHIILDRSVLAEIGVL